MKHILCQVITRALRGTFNSCLWESTQNECRYTNSSVYMLCDTSTIHDALAYSRSGIPSYLKGGFIAEVTLYDGRPYCGMVNGIRNRPQDCLVRVQRAALESGFNMLCAYCPTAGLTADVLRLFQREYAGFKTPTMEYDMVAHMMRVGLERNRVLRINTFKVAAHSNGYHLALEAVTSLHPHAWSQVVILGTGGVGNDIDARQKGVSCHRVFATRDVAARVANLWNARESVQFVRSTDGPIESHFIDRSIYWLRTISFFKEGYGIES